MNFYRARTERKGHEGLSATMRATGIVILMGWSPEY